MQRADVDRTHVDASVKKDISERVVPVPVDATDDSDPATTGYLKEYKVIGLPTIIVFDKSGKEVARATEAPSPERMRDMLALTQ